MKKVPIKQQIADLAYLIKAYGINHVIICPGSRNAPLIQVFHRDPHFRCYSCVDERSAGYFALGIARTLREPVVVVTTSGTAALNLGPAVAEAFCQQVPLILLTADRPKEWPPQFNNQVVDQQGIFSGNSKDFYEIPAEIADADTLALVNSELSRIIATAAADSPGPVHLNILLKEPLYEEIPPRSAVAAYQTGNNYLNGKKTDKLLQADEDLISEYLTGRKKMMVLAGMHAYTSEEKYLLDSLSSIYQVVVIAENISNLFSSLFISRPELVLGALSEAGRQLLYPDLIIAFGGQVVSKKLKIFVQDLKKDCPVRALDFFPLECFRSMVRKQEMTEENRFLSIWKTAENVACNKAQGLLNLADYCNLTAIGKAMDAIPEESVIHLGNSSVIRYAQLFPVRPDLRYFSNRGTSGIDGCLSVAVGSAMVSDSLHVAILGDLSFVYDSNGMWSRNFPDNLRIIVINDGGGGIFRILDGPDRMPFFEEFSVTRHPVSIRHLSEAFGLKHLIARNFAELKSGLDDLFDTNTGSNVLEVETVNSENSRIFKQFFNSIRSS